MSLYWFGPLESNTLRAVVGVDYLKFGRDDHVTRGSPRPPYIGQRMRSVPRLLVGYDQESWSVTTRRPKFTLHILPYPVDLS
jgi:hypothetical protein